MHYKGTGKNAKNWQGPVTGGTQTNVSGNASGNAAATKFNKGKFSSQTNVTGGAKFQKKHFNLQTNQVNTKYKTVNFNQNYKIAGAHNWKGSKYVVFQITGTQRGVMLPTPSIIMMDRFTLRIRKRIPGRW